MSRPVVSASRGSGGHLRQGGSRLLPVAILWGWVGVVTGCAPSLATMQPAHVGPKGTVQFAAAMEIGVPTGTIIETIDTGKTLSSRALNGQTLTNEDREQLFRAGINWLGSPPQLGPHFAANYAPIDRFEVGLRYAGQGWRVGSRYQFLRHQDGPFDLVVGVGVARSTYTIPLSDVIPVLNVDDFTRWTFDVPILIGTSRSWFETWIGPKLVHSRFGVGMRLDIPNESPELAHFDGSTTFLGGVGGVAVGYRYLFVAFELTLGHISGSATADLTTAGVARSADLSGMIVYPTVGLIGEI